MRIKATKKNRRKKFVVQGQPCSTRIADAIDEDKQDSIYSEDAEDLVCTQPDPHNRETPNISSERKT